MIDGTKPLTEQGKIKPSILDVEDSVLAERLKGIVVERKKWLDYVSDDRIAFIVKDMFGLTEDNLQYEEKFNLIRSIQMSNREYELTQGYNDKKISWREPPVLHREMFECGCIVDFTEDKSEGVAVNICEECGG